jgi:hypothetical protein
MTNRGIAPLDPSSDVGKVRLLVGDTVYTALVPPEVGYGDYTNFSDDEIEAFLTAGGDSTMRAAGFAYMQLAATAAMESVSIADYDLKVDLTKRAGDLRAMAEFYFEQADQIDGASEDAFIIVPTGQRDDCWPELAERPVWWC